MKPHSRGYVIVPGGRLEHVVVAELAYGKPLPAGAEVHHWNSIRTDNRQANLCICPSRNYHMMLHYRARALDACGHADWFKCQYCKQYDDSKNLVRQDRQESHGGMYYRHRACATAREKQRWQDRKNRKQLGVQ